MFMDGAMGTIRRLIPIVARTHPAFRGRPGAASSRNEAERDDPAGRLLSVAAELRAIATQMQENEVDARHAGGTRGSRSRG